MKETMMYVWCRPSLVSLMDILADAASQFSNAQGFVFTPNCASFVALRDGEMQAAGQIQVADVFEARMFSPTAELRWWHPPEAPRGSGQAVMVTESDEPPGASWIAAANSPRQVHTLLNKYLLWGQTGNDTPMPGWCRLLEARIGALDVPFGPVAAGSRVVLETVEYVDVIDEYSNRDVIDERLIRLNVLS